MKKKSEEKQHEYITKFKSKLRDRKAWPLWIPKHYGSSHASTPTDHLRELLAKYLFECPKCGEKLTQLQYDRLKEDDAYRTLINEEWKQCSKCKKYVHFKRKVIKTRLGQRREIERRFRAIQREHEIPLSNNQARDFFRAIDRRDREFVPIAEKQFQGHRPTEAEIKELEEIEKPYLRGIYKTLGLNICATPGCYEIFSDRSNKKYHDPKCQTRHKQRRYRVKKKQ